MLVPKISKVKYKSVKRVRARGARRLIRSLQFECFEGYFPMQCNSCHLSKSCWFCGLKPLKGD